MAKRDSLRETLVVSEAIRRTMRGNRSKDTIPEIRFRQALWRSGVRGYRLHMKALPGSPDLTFTKKRLAVFVHGCFWHGCPHCTNYREPKTNSRFWRNKLEENKARDRRSIQRLEDLGMTVKIV